MAQLELPRWKPKNLHRVRTAVLWLVAPVLIVCDEVWPGLTGGKSSTKWIVFILNMLVVIPLLWSIFCRITLETDGFRVRVVSSIGFLRLASKFRLVESVTLGYVQHSRRDPKAVAEQFLWVRVEGGKRLVLLRGNNCRDLQSVWAWLEANTRATYEEPDEAGSDELM